MSLGGKGGGSKTQTQTTDIPGWMKPYAETYLTRATDLSNKPYEAYGGQTVAAMDPRLQQGLDIQAQLGTQGTAAGNAGQAGLQDVLGGKYLEAGSNPYLQSQIDAAQQDLIRNYNTVAKPAIESAMVNSGSFGNSGLQQMQGQQQSDLQRNLGQISTQMRGNAYNTERANQMQALGLTPTFNNMSFQNAQAVQGAGQAQQAQTQNELTDAYQRWQQAQQDPYTKLGVYGNALGTVLGRGSTTTTTGGGGSGGAGILGGAMAGSQLGSQFGPWGSVIGGIGGAFLGSDERLKEDIKKVGKTDDGLNVYTYRYKSGGPTHMGVMAQEVKGKHPDAIGRMADGMMAVDYSKLGGRRVVAR